MARQNIDIVIAAKDLFSEALRKAQSGFRQTGQVIGRAIKAGALIGAAALGVLAAAMFKGVKAANVQEDAETRLRAALGHTSQALLDQASALQKVTKFGDEQIIKAQSLIAAFVKDEDQIKAATKATLDLAAAKGMDLTAAADLVSKTLGSSTNAMSRYGIQVEGAVGSTERLESLTTSVSGLFGGQAAAQAQNYGGRIQQLSNAFGDVLEEIGFLITKSKFMNEAISLGTRTLAQWGQQIRENRVFLMDLAKNGIVWVVEGIGSAVKVLQFFHQGWVDVKQAANTAISIMANQLAEMAKKAGPLLRFLGKGGMVTALEEFGKSTQSVMEDAETDILKVNAGYMTVGNTIDSLASKLKNISSAELALPTPSAVPGIAGGGGEEELSPVTLAQSEADKIISIHQNKFEQLAEMERAVGLNKREQSALELQLQLEKMEADRIRLEENNLLTVEIKDQFRQAEFDAVTLHEARLTEIEDKEKSNRLKLEAKATKAQINMKRNVANSAIAFIQAIAPKSKAAALLGIAIAKGAAIASASASMFASANLAFASQLIPGDPSSLARAHAARVQALAVGKLNIALIAATGFAQAAGALGGGGGGGGGGLGGVTPEPQIGAGDGVLVSDEQAREQQAVSIVIHTDGVLTSETVDKLVEPLVEGINKAGKERNVLIDIEALATA